MQVWQQSLDNWESRISYLLLRQDSMPLITAFLRATDDGLHNGIVVMPYWHYRTVMRKQDSGMLGGMVGGMKFPHDNIIAQYSQTGLTIWCDIHFL